MNHIKDHEIAEKLLGWLILGRTDADIKHKPVLVLHNNSSVVSWIIRYWHLETKREQRPQCPKLPK